MQWNHNNEYHQTYVAGVKKDGLWGIMDKHGKIIWEPIWKEILINSEQVRVLDTNDKYGYLDGHGNMMIEPKYDFAIHAFEHDIAQVGRDFGYTYIDNQGNELMPLQPEMMYADRLGEYFYYNKDGKGFIFDRSGNMISNGKYDNIVMYHTNCIIAKQNDKQGVVNINDEIIIPFEYDSIRYDYDFANPLIGTFYAQKSNKVTFFDENGKQIGNKEWDASGYGSGKSVIYIKENYKYGLMDKSGTIISEPIYEDFSNLSEDESYFGVKLKGLVGVVKSDGTYLIEPKWDIPINGIYPLGNGMFELSTDNYNDYKHGLLDEKGNLIIEPMFDRLEFRRGQLIVGLGENWYSVELSDNPETRSDDMLTRKEPAPEADFLVEKGVLKGYESGDLRLWDTATRAEFVSLLQRVEGWENEEGSIIFDDVQGHWAKDAIAAAVNRGLINGYDEKTFKPDECVTYTQAMTIILRAIGFTDDYIENYPAGGISTLAHDAKVNPQGMSYSWNDAAPREAVAKMLYQYIHTDMTVEKVRELPPKLIEYF
ncbi:MAG: Surface layer protein precursor [Firmicutes bacterium ADurb.Bin193]|nr:MAG: Surface layer protein precursor [Firmicutes bacterium ADurb.Bin193]